jgi:hypothetical protein
MAHNGAPVAQLDRASGYEDCSHEESTSYTERYELLPSATSAMPTAVSIAARTLGSTQSGLVVDTKLGTFTDPVYREFHSIAGPCNCIFAGIPRTKESKRCSGFGIAFGRILTAWCANQRRRRRRGH